MSDEGNEDDYNGDICWGVIHKEGSGSSTNLKGKKNDQ